MKSIILAAIAAVALVGAGNANAADWTYAEATFGWQDSGQRTTEAYSLNGSYAITDNVFVQGGYTKSLADARPGAVSVSVGGNYNQWYGKVSAATVVENRAHFDKWNYSAEAGLRSNISDRIEVRAAVVADGLRAQKFDDVSWLAAVGAEYAVTDAFRLGLNVKGRSSYQEASIGVRWYF